MRDRGLHGVEFVVADDHAGLRAAVREVVPEAWFQRCYVHFLRNALDHLPRKADVIRPIKPGSKITWSTGSTSCSPWNWSTLHHAEPKTA